MSPGGALAEFAVCALLIAVAGAMLSLSADKLARLRGWGRGWVGLALLATVTSLPELASGVSAVTLVDAPDLAVGNALGACVLNLLFLGVVDALQRGQPMYREAGSVHLLSAAFGMVMLGFVALGLLAETRVPSLAEVGLYSPLLLGLYLLAVRSVSGHESGATEAADRGPTERGSGEEEARQWRRFASAALVVLVAGMWLPEAAQRLAASLGLSESLVGTVGMAVVTTLPEMAVTLTALRIGALDMAIGNLLGSNLFNVAILAVDDLFYRRGPLLAATSPAHQTTAVTAMLMVGLVSVGLVMRPQRRALRLASWVSLGLVAAYAINVALHALAER